MTSLLVNFLELQGDHDMNIKKEYRFTVIIEPCEEGGYFAMCPAFPGCHVKERLTKKLLKK